MVTDSKKRENAIIDETYMLFMKYIPAESQEFVLELDKYLTEKGSKRTIKTAKSGFVTSYSSPKSGKALLNEERNFAAVRKLVESEIDYVNRG